MTQKHLEDRRVEAVEAALRELRDEQRRMVAELRREKRHAEATARRWRLAAALAVLLGMVLSPVLTRTGSAAAPDTKTPPVPKRLATLEKAVFGVSPVPANTTDRITIVQSALTQETAAREAVQNTVTGVQSSLSTTQSTLATVQSSVSTLQSSVTSLQSSVTSLQSSVTPLQSSVASLQSSVASQAAILAPFSVRFFNGTDASGGYDVYLTGANLHLLNGLGATNGEPDNPTDTANPVTNGLGNVIIGYNERSANPLQTGSHNLVVGINHTFTSFGGAVIGLANSITAPFASVTGGSENTASGAGASVTGGSENIAVGGLACAAGGFSNVASGALAVVTGGFSNVSSGQQASVSGGFFNTASATLSSIGGGLGLTSDTSYGWASGGQNPSSPVDGEYPFYAGVFHSP